MGIPSYFLHIVKRHPSILKKIALLGPNIDNFYADCNGIIYNAVYETVIGTKNIDVYEAEIIIAVYSFVYGIVNDAITVCIKVINIWSEQGDFFKNGWVAFNNV